MRFEIRIQPQPAADAWQVQILPDGQPDPAFPAYDMPRRLSANNPADPTRIFPAPAAAPVLAPAGQPVPAGAARHSLLAAGSDDIWEAYNRVTNRQARAGDLEELGGYLFACLLGDQVWQAICDRAGPRQPVELALWWPDAGAQKAEWEWPLARLPWEIMRGSDNFLAAAPGRLAAVTRLVDGPPLANGQLSASAPLRVLFVVGSDLHDKEIQPAAEYFGLLRRMEQKALAINSRLLLRASLEELGDEIAQFRPAVVHLICHGVLQGKDVSLQLMSHERHRQKVSITADSLAPVLSQAGPPPMVVLNACYAGRPAAQQSVPFAARLVQLGVPVVVGMAGRVSDLACRYFTRRFYEALLSGESMAEATAVGRWAAFTQAGDALRQSDWGFPTLFLARGLSPVLKLDEAGQTAATQLVERANSFRLINRPPVFCGRLAFMADAYRELVSTAGSARRVLVAKVMEADNSTTDQRRFGKTRLLEELAARAVLDGHAACLLRYSRSADPPASAWMLAQHLMDQLVEMNKGLGLNPQHDFELRRVLQKLRNPATAVALAPDIQYHLDNHGLPADGDLNKLDRRIVAAALREDLLRSAAEVTLRGQVDLAQVPRDQLAALARQTRQAQPGLPGARLLVLIDEVHRFGKEALSLLLDHLLGPSGLGSSDLPVPLVLALSTATSQEYSTAVTALIHFLSNSPAFVNQLELDRFRDPQADPVLYRHFLLGLSQPLVFTDRATDEDINELFREMSKRIDGVPSLLNDPVVQGMITVAQAVRFLAAADDTQFLDQFTQWLEGT